RSGGGLIVFGIAALLGSLAVAGHHLFTLWRDFGNPTFPFLNQIFQSPFYEPEPIRDSRFLPHDVWQVIAYPFFSAKTNIYLVTEMTFRDWRGAIAYAAITAGLLKLAAGHVLRGRRDGAFAETRDETRDLGLVFIFTVVSFVLWELGFGLYRYAVALEML